MEEIMPPWEPNKVDGKFYTGSQFTNSHNYKRKKMNTLRETIKSMFIRRGFGKRIVIPLIKENGSKQNLVYELEDIISAIINIYE